jgi:hypothetical protein
MPASKLTPKAVPLQTIQKRFTNCPNLCVPPQNSARQKAYRKQVRYSETETLGATIKKLAVADSFQKLYERCQQCVVKDGDYIGGQ